tara:strand:+ start:76 stop:432 length:357 start_codon:yes stop_codon:yes gene_type:complete
MRAGELNEKITIKRVTRTVNSYGDAIDALSDFKVDVRCKIMHLGTPSAGASEFNDDAQTVAEMKAEFRCRYISGLRFDDVIIWNGGTFDIYSIIPIGRREGMNVRARLRDNEGTLPTT